MTNIFVESNNEKYDKTVYLIIKIRLSEMRDLIEISQYHILIFSQNSHKYVKNE